MHAELTTLRLRCSTWRWTRSSCRSSSGTSRASCRRLWRRTTSRRCVSQGLACMRTLMYSARHADCEVSACFHQCDCNNMLVPWRRRSRSRAGGRWASTCARGRRWRRLATTAARRPKSGAAHCLASRSRAVTCEQASSTLGFSGFRIQVCRGYDALTNAEMLSRKPWETHDDWFERAGSGTRSTRRGTRSRRCRRRRRSWRTSSWRRVTRRWRACRARCRTAPCSCRRRCKCVFVCKGSGMCQRAARTLTQFDLGRPVLYPYMCQGMT